MKNKILIINIILLLGVILFSMMGIIHLLGEYIYPLDDTYIHLSIAKNFALDGVWGITKYKYSSTTSSPFFTLLLSVIIKILGNNQYIPIAINAIGGMGIIYTIHKFFSQSATKVYAVAIMLVIWLMPMYLMILMGMEHILHTLFMVIFLMQLEKYSNLSKGFVLLCIYAMVATGLRYESLFFIFFACLYLFFIKRKFAQSIILGLVAISPVIIYGLISISQGAYFLPNSLILKGNTSNGIYSFVLRILSNGYRAISLLPLVIFLMVLILKKWREEERIIDFVDRYRIQIIILLGFGIHLCFANFGWLVRYEAYLLVLLVLAIKPILELLFSTEYKFKILKIIFIILLLIPSKIRLIDTLKYQKIASKNIFDQHIQMAKFLQNYYHNSKIVANDIGAITYFTNIHLLDIYGLGSEEIVEIRKKDQGKFDNQNKELTKFVKDYSEQEKYDIAIVYEEWITMPDNFIKVGEWTIKNGYIVGGNTVSFYAIGQDKKQKLINDLKKYEKHLPKDVIFTYK